ncbi:MAG TPA: phosphatidylglycerophosphatase A [Xanthomonadaceae bacterium]|jgi:phosphatidylglycerophosphatase A|nr:phosphatidylglycerophosphatase A [Xanthomonadaceae bacterium]
MTLLPVGTRRRMMRHPRGWIAAGFGAGFSPKAPGTVGSLVAILPWWLWMHDLPAAEYAAVLILAFAVGIWAARWAIRESGVADPSIVVWDEFVGVWLALWLVPAEWPWVLAAFGVFRLFDVCKPWPVRWADRHVKGAFGTMLDDALAGLMALAVMQLALSLWPLLAAPA